MRRRWLLAGLAGIAVLLAGAGVVMAQSGDGGSGTFLDRVAQKLGIEPDKLQQAVKDTRKEDIDAAVQKGDITQEQADRLKQRIDNGDLPGPFGGGPFERGPHGPGGGAFGLGLDVPRQLDNLAAFLGITTDQLRQELSADNATLASVAEAHGKGRDDLKNFLSGEIQKKLDQAVADGNLTQKVADEIKAKADAALDGMIDGRFGFGKGRFDFEWKGHMDGGAETQPDAPAPQIGSGPGAGRS